MKALFSTHPTHSPNLGEGKLALISCYSSITLIKRFTFFNTYISSEKEKFFFADNIYELENRLTVFVHHTLAQAQLNFM